MAAANAPIVMKEALTEFEESGDPERHFQALLALEREGVEKGKVVAIGECGLDYDRLQFCPADIQKKTGSGTFSACGGDGFAGGGGGRISVDVFSWHDDTLVFAHGSDLLSTAKKMALGQSVYGPLMTIIFFKMNAALQGLGLGGGTPLGEWNRDNDSKKVLFRIGGGHYVPRHMDIIWKNNIWVGHLVSGYALPMDNPGSSKTTSSPEDIGGTWKQSITVAYEATKTSFPGGEIMAHLDQKSFKSWQKKAINAYLNEQNIKIGKPTDFN